MSVDESEVEETTVLRRVPEASERARVLRQVTTTKVVEPQGVWWAVSCTDLLSGDIAWERCDTEARARAVHRKFARDFA